MSNRGLAVAIAVLALSWGFSALAILRPEALWPGEPSSASQAAHAAAPAAPDRSRSARHATASRFDLPRAMEPLPVRMEFAHPPRAGILFEVHTGRVLWRYRPRRALPIASLTKMLTALVIARAHHPGEQVPVTPEALAYEGSGIGVLPKGKRVSLGSLFDGLLLVSGNDAAIALAQHDAGSVPAFVARMNAFARRLGLECSHFASPSGIVDRDNYSCPRDLAALARADLANPWIRRVVAKREARLRFPIKGGYLDLFNNNPFILAGMEGITGLKTGYTDAAGRCYVITQKVGGHELGVVLLDTPNPLAQVPTLLHAGAVALAGDRRADGPRRSRERSGRT